MKINKIIQMSVLAISVLISVPDSYQLQAKGSSSSRSSSSSKSSWSSSKSTKSSSGWNAKSTKTTKPTTSSGSSWNSKKTTTSSSKPQLTKVQQAQKTKYDKAKASGKAFESRSAAVADFKNKNANKYPSTFKEKPAQRPDYIPEKTTVGGNTYNVTYNQDRGGYGYMNSLGTWMMFDALTDVATMSMLMDRQGYYIGSAPVVGTGTTVVHHSNGIGNIITLIIVGAIVIFVIIVFFD